MKTQIRKYSIHKEVREIDPNKPMVALTFDDGPSRLYTPAILDLLNEHNVAATFFILGSLGENYEDLLARIVNEGHEIGIHSFNHVPLTELTNQDLYFQLFGTQEVIENATGTSAKIMRPTYGFVNADLAEKTPFPLILWSLDTMDWESRNPNAVYTSILSQVKDGDIILLHDIFGSTADAMKDVIPALLDKGFQLVTVSELAQHRGVAMENGKIYSRFPPDSAP